MTRVWTADGWQRPQAEERFWESRGVLHGLGCFETMRVQDGVVLRWELHRARWHKAWQRLRFSPQAWDELFALSDLHELCHAAGPSGGVQRLRLTALAAEGGLHDLASFSQPWVGVSLSPVSAAPRSLHLALCPWTRNSCSPLAGMKCTAYAENLIALDLARQHGVDELLWLNERGEICEASTSNVIWWQEGRWHTPALASGCLPGVLRTDLLNHAATTGQPWQECGEGIEALRSAQAVVLISALRGPQWVRSLRLSDDDCLHWQEPQGALRLEFEQLCERSERGGTP